eukprot:353522-Chlamydomonas_euryale.AAC.7
MVATLRFAPKPEVEGVMSGLLQLVIADSPANELPRCTLLDRAGLGIAPLNAGVRPGRRTLLPFREAASDMIAKMLIGNRIVELRSSFVHLLKPKEVGREPRCGQPPAELGRPPGQMSRDTALMSSFLQGRTSNGQAR